MFKSMDTDNSGTITFEELKAGLAKQGANLAESEVRQLMEAVSVSPFLSHSFFSLSFADLVCSCIQTNGF
jgi:Ca2+-binding EF-hand superfamily protein